MISNTGDFETFIAECQVLQTIGPLEGYSGYYLHNTANNTLMPVYTVLNFFLKFIDENTDRDSIDLSPWGTTLTTERTKIDDRTTDEDSFGQIAGTY
jgi:hypothetical protein